MEENRLVFLIIGFLDKSISAKDYGELYEWIAASDKNLQLFLKLTDKDNISHALERYWTSLLPACTIERVRQKIGINTN